MSKPSENLVILIDIITTQGRDCNNIGHQDIYLDRHKTRFIWSLCCKMLYVYKKGRTKRYNIGEIYPEYFN